MNIQPPLIQPDSNFTFGIYNNDVNIYGKLNVITSSITNLFALNLSATTSIISNLSATTSTISNLSTSVFSATTSTITNLSVTNLTGLSQFSLTPLISTQFSVTTVTLPGSYVYNNIYYSNTSDTTHIKLPTASSITTASDALQNNPDQGADFWIMANSGDIKLSENPPNVAFSIITGQTLTIPSNSVGHFKIYSPASGIYRVYSLGISSYV